MNDCCIARSATLFRRCHLNILSVLAVAIAGCNFGGGAPPPSAQLAAETLSKWYTYYRAEHNGKPPQSEEEFIGFVQGKIEERGDVFDRAELFVSPGDEQEFVINYGEPTSKNPEKNVALYEKEGYDGKKWVAFESNYAFQVEEAELQRMLAGEE